MAAALFGYFGLVKDVCAWGDMDFSIVFAVVAVLVLAYVGIAAHALARLLVLSERFVAPLLRVASVTAFAAAMALLVWAIPPTFRKPTADRYIEFLPVFAVVSPVAGEPLRVIKGEVQTLDPAALKSYTTQIYELPLPQDLVATFGMDALGRVDEALFPSPPGFTRGRWGSGGISANISLFDASSRLTRSFSAR